LLATLSFVSCAAQTPFLADVSSLGDPKLWSLTNVERLAAPDEAGRRAVTLAPIGGNGSGSNVGLATVAGLTFSEGAIDVDLRGNGETSASFVGIAFGLTDAAHYEAIYFRPFRFRSTNPLERSHAVQYIAWPANTWEVLRQRSPGVYESAIDPVPDPAGWFHARIEVERSAIRVFVEGSSKPTLVVQRLTGASGSVALWVDSQPAAFANLQVRARQ
jgi:hypothetical protein